MITFESLKSVFEKERISVFRIVDIGDLFQTGFLMPEVSELIKLAKSTQIERVLIYEHYEDDTDYYITQELFDKETYYDDEEFVDYILPQIYAYNEKIANIDFSYPAWIAAICLCDNRAFFVLCNNERTIDGEALIEPKEMFKLIKVSNEEQCKKIHEDNKNKTEVLCKELRKQILEDDDFKLCTNQALRRNYARKLRSRLPKRFAPLIKIMYRDNFDILSNYGREFIELVWREIKDRDK